MIFQLHGEHDVRGMNDPPRIERLSTFGMPRPTREQDPGGVQRPEIAATTLRRRSASIVVRVYSSGSGGRAKEISERRNCMPLAIGFVPPTWISRAPVSARIWSALAALIPPPGITVMRSPARSTSDAIRVI